jgi:hypothetical protein
VLLIYVCFISTDNLDVLRIVNSRVAFTCLGAEYFSQLHCLILIAEIKIIFPMAGKLLVTD